MPRLNLTGRAIAKLPAPDPSGQQVYHWDTSMRGFGVAGRTNCFGVPEPSTWAMLLIGSRELGSWLIAGDHRLH
jgi:hypothetical protein